ncbi:unnamed protein product [Tuber melanosporum]|uniref:(Perigord truffle) hypothetical protein n=1 Tax=Tuber melanosporum (strain Mel28) TaxID=656061 RepID=D5GET1_TUBMM|nr:uncharacterized protein GSTUM_00001357001 [Tuber melanosporum]CAZ83024.1 unnamed protein product [Tuber melanosporum]
MGTRDETCRASNYMREEIARLSVSPIYQSILSAAIILSPPTPVLCVISCHLQPTRQRQHTFSGPRTQHDTSSRLHYIDLTSNQPVSST